MSPGCLTHGRGPDLHASDTGRSGSDQVSMSVVVALRAGEHSYAGSGSRVHGMHAFDQDGALVRQARRVEDAKNVA